MATTRKMKPPSPDPTVPEALEVQAALEKPLSMAQNEPGSTIAPYPGYPLPAFGCPIGSVGERIFSTGRQAIATEVAWSQVAAISTMACPPEVWRYKAEVLEWLRNHPKPIT